MLQAVGYGMLDKNGNQVPFGANGLKELVKITDEDVIPELKECNFRIAWLMDYAKLTSAQYEKADATYPEAGAAGGMGFAFLSYTNAVLQSGIKIVLEETKLEEYIKEADLVVTGEGRMDGQTAFGKAPIGVAKIAKKYDKTVIAFAGSVAEDAVVCNELGIDAIFSIIRNIQTLPEAMDVNNARENMIATVEQVFRLIEKLRC